MSERWYTRLAQGVIALVVILGALHAEPAHSGSERRASRPVPAGEVRP